VLTKLPTPMTVCEAEEFLARAEKVWSADDRAEFVDFIALHPEAGDLIPGTGGIRKVRWTKPGSGKRGGVRVIYYYYDTTVPLYLVTMFAKNQKSDLNPADKKALAEFAKSVKETIKSGRRAQDKKK